MRYCPECQAEYQDEVFQCSDCEKKLLTEEEYYKLKEEKERYLKKLANFSKVCTLKNKFEADLLTNALEKEDIPVIVKEFQDTAYNGIFIPQFGWGVLMVPKEELERAEKIVMVIRKDFENQF